MIVRQHEKISDSRFPCAIKVRREVQRVNDDKPTFRNKPLALAFMEAIARNEGVEQLRCFLVEKLRSSDDAVCQALADMFDPAADTPVRASLTLGWRDHANPARDIEIAHAVNALLKDGKSQKTAFHEVATQKRFVRPASKNKRERVLSDRQVKEIWLKQREKISDDATWFANHQREIADDV
ncbi:hypothetical protein [Rhizobium sp. BR 362]|uniref:hypothetical protein n=1 Tax=Rhizobium sp. BR 362 TaxID=3040670 RepID=UPI002F41F599